MGRCCLLVLSVTAMCTVVPAQPGDARYVFAGSVQKTNASNVKMLPASPRTVVVKVDRVIKAPDTMDNFTGREVTVELLRDNSVKAGQQAIFLTNPSLFGENLAVREVSHQAVNNESKLKESLTAASVLAADSALTDRLRRAVLVVTGRVLDVRPLEPAGPGRRSEHEPEWWEARVEVREIHKGQSGDKAITVLYANSTDEMWYRTHKFKSGDEGIFILQTQPAEAYGVKGFTALHPLDFQPLGGRDRILRLLQAIR